MVRMRKWVRNSIVWRKFDENRFETKHFMNIVVRTREVLVNIIFIYENSIWSDIKMGEKIAGKNPVALSPCHVKFAARALFSVERRITK